MMTKEYQRFTNWMEKHQNKIIYGMMYDGEIYSWNSYIPEDATKNHLLDIKRCLLDSIKLIDDALQIDDGDNEIEKDVTDFMQKKGVESRCAEGGGKLIKYHMITSHYISDDDQKTANSKYVRDILKNTIENDEEIDRIYKLDIFSGLYWFLFDLILHHENDCVLLPHANG
ncbi:unnamed protein product, partial [marine sediment metagenome]